MLEESLLKTNFIGRDGFRWWIGQVAPQEAQKSQLGGGGWGNRFKVRILGYHPYSVVDLPDDDLPWAQALLGCSDGSGAANRGTSVKIAPGDSVLGFFLDGDNAQIPVILGVFGRTLSVPSEDYVSPFVPFTGYTGRITNDGSKLAKNQSNEQNANSAKSPRSVDKATADKINKKTESSTQIDPAIAAEDAALAEAQAKEKAEATKEISASKTIGQKVTAASSDRDSAPQTIKNDVDNFVKRISDIRDGIEAGTNAVTDFVSNKKQALLKEIDSMTASIQKGTTRMINDMTMNLTKALIPTLNSGLQFLYDQVYALVLAATRSPAAAEKAGTIAQALFIGPIKKLSDAIPCVANNVINGIGETIKGLLTSVADNVTNFVSCIGDQVVGALMNQIIGSVTKFLSPLMGGLDKILQGFSVLDFFRKTGDSILGLADRLGCNEIAPDYDLVSNEWVIGKGSTDKVGVPVNEILDTANQAQSIGDAAINVVQDIAAATGSLGVFDFMNPSVSVPGFKSALGNCFAGFPELGGCGGTKIKIFGGSGQGGTANAIFGAIESIANGGRGLTGSLIGVDLVNGGGGYTFPPFVEIVDECGSGFGASARAVIDYDEDSPTYQQITDIYIVTEGEDYVIGDDLSEYVPNDINGPLIVSPGAGYSPDDIALDSNGNQYTVKVDDVGGITNATRIGDGVSITYKPVDNLVTFDVRTRTGSGAIFKPRLIKRPEEYQGEVKRVVDCISNENNLVGYVNGKEYYGPFHVHPNNGRKMVGSRHTQVAHQYIYDTPEASLGSRTSSVSTTTQVNVETTTTTAQTAASDPTPTPTPTPDPTPTPTPPPSSPQSTPPPSSPPSSPPPSSPPSSPPPSSGGGSGGYY